MVALAPLTLLSTMALEMVMGLFKAYVPSFTITVSPALATSIADWMVCLAAGQLVPEFASLPAGLT